MVHRSGCGFVSFKNRNDAEDFALSISQNGLNSNASTAGLVIFERYPVRVSWSTIKALPVNKDEQAKLNMVAVKAMKQLADRDRENKKRKPERQVERKDKKRAPMAEKKTTNAYKAISDDFEL